ncbi:MAG: hydroxymethylbilane synthase, partial [Gemmatimonadaceae bacterium]
MEILACLPRADARDVLVAWGATSIAHLAAGARVGSSSPRRACQFRAMRPDLNIVDIRGNVDTRLAKLDRGEYDAIILAAAGLARLGLLYRATEFFGVESMIPSAGQGAIALETEKDSPFASMLRQLSDNETFTAVTAERAFAERVDGSCELPIAAHAVLNGETLVLEAMLGNLDGRFVSGSLSGSVQDAVHIGQLLADSLLAGGGAELLGRAVTHDAT